MSISERKHVSDGEAPNADPLYYEPQALEEKKNEGLRIARDLRSLDNLPLCVDHADARVPKTRRFLHNVTWLSSAPHAWDPHQAGPCFNMIRGQLSSSL